MEYPASVAGFKRNFPTNAPSTRQVIAWHKKLWDIKGIKGVCVAVVVVRVRPRFVSLALPLFSDGA